MNNNDVNKFIDIVKEMIKREIPAQQNIIGTIETTFPTLTVRHGDMLFPMEMILVSNYLMPEYHRDYKLEGVITKHEQDVSKYEFNNTTVTGLASPGPHDHAINYLTGDGTISSTGEYHANGKIWWLDTFVPGDKVLMTMTDLYVVIITKVVSAIPGIAGEGV